MKGEIPHSLAPFFQEYDLSQHDRPTFVKAFSREQAILLGQAWLED